MAYATYTTEAIVCGSKDSYTSDRSYMLFTRDAGMLWASARSVRVEHSKQRFALQDFSHIRVSLVRGRSGWRIGSVEAIANPFMAAADRESRTYVQAIVRLLRRFVHGEDPIPQVFLDTVTALSEGDMDRRLMQDVYTLRLLHQLGYIAPHAVFADFLDQELHEVSKEALPPLAERAIERALSASHL